MDLELIQKLSIKRFRKLRILKRFENSFLCFYVWFLENLRENVRKRKYKGKVKEKKSKRKEKVKENKKQNKNR